MWPRKGEPKQRIIKWRYGDSGCSPVISCPAVVAPRTSYLHRKASTMLICITTSINILKLVLHSSSRTHFCDSTHGWDEIKNEGIDQKQSTSWDINYNQQNSTGHSRRTNVDALCLLVGEYLICWSWKPDSCLLTWMDTSMEKSTELKIVGSWLAN